MASSMWQCVICQFYNYEKEPKCFKCFNDRIKVTSTTSPGHVGSPSQVHPRSTTPTRRYGLTSPNPTIPSSSFQSPHHNVTMSPLASSVGAEHHLKSIREDLGVIHQRLNSPHVSPQRRSASPVAAQPQAPLPSTELKIERDSLQRRVRMLEDSLKTLRATTERLSLSPERRSAHRTASTQLVSLRDGSTPRQTDPPTTGRLSPPATRRNNNDDEKHQLQMQVEESSRDAQRQRVLQQREIAAIQVAATAEKEEALRQVVNAERAADVLRAETQRLRQELANVRKLQEMSRLADREEAAGIQNTLRAECESLRNELQQLRRCNDVISAGHNAQRTEEELNLESARAEISRLRRAGFSNQAAEARLTAEIESLSRQLAQSQKDVEKYRGEATAARRKVHELEDSVATSTSRYISERDEAVRLHRQALSDVQTQRAEVQRLLKQIVECTNREAELRKNLVDETSLSVLRTELSVLRTTHTAVVNERDDLLRQIRSVEENLSDSRQELSKVRSQLVKVCTEPTVAASAELDSARKRLTEMELDLQRVRAVQSEALNVARDEADRAKSELMITRAELSSVKIQLAASEKELRQVLSQLDNERALAKQQTPNSVAARAFQIEKAELQQKITSLEAQVESDTRKLAFLTSANQKLTAQLGTSKPSTNTNTNPPPVRAGSEELERPSSNVPTPTPALQTTPTSQPLAAHGAPTSPSGLPVHSALSSHHHGDSTSDHPHHVHFGGTDDQAKVKPTPTNEPQQQQQPSHEVHPKYPKTEYVKPPQDIGFTALSAIYNTRTSTCEGLRMVCSDLAEELGIVDPSIEAQSPATPPRQPEAPHVVAAVITPPPSIENTTSSSSTGVQSPLLNTLASLLAEDGVPAGESVLSTISRYDA